MLTFHSVATLSVGTVNNLSTNETLELLTDSMATEWSHPNDGLSCVFPVTPNRVYTHLHTFVQSHICS